MGVDEGFYIGMMASKGASSGTHLHYATDYDGAWYTGFARNFSILATLVPETNQGNYPALLNDTVTTCYSQ
jgi:hypothetical protein